MTLKRPLHPMPDDVNTALHERKMFDAYLHRPDYQRNDYLSWIDRAKDDATRDKRIKQMLAELKAGDSYMNMEWHGRQPAKH